MGNFSFRNLTKHFFHVKSHCRGYLADYKKYAAEIFLAFGMIALTIVIPASSKVYATSEYYKVKVGNDVVGNFANKSEAEKVRSSLEKNFLIDGSSNVSVKFDPEIEVERIVHSEQEKELSNVKMSRSVEDVVKKILTGGKIRKEHVIAEGDTYWDIASKYGKSVDEILKFNGIDSSYVLYPGNKLYVDDTSSLTNIVVTQQVTKQETIKRQVEVQNDSSMEAGQKKVITEGSDGLQEKVINYTSENGVIIKEDVLSTKVLKEAVTQVIKLGTKKTVKTYSKSTGNSTASISGSGGFVWPTVSRRIYSYYGYRWGKIHEGIDIAGSVGTPIYAAGGGTVISAGVDMTGSLTVAIKHPNGLVTMYAHCSSISVRAGQSVSAGQTIARIGQTGIATGPHLHFGVFVGKPFGPSINPLRVL